MSAAASARAEPTFPSRPLDLVEQVELKEWDEAAEKAKKAPRGHKERAQARLGAKVHARLAENLGVAFPRRGA